MSFAEWSNEKKKREEEEQEKRRSENTKAATGLSTSFSEWSNKKVIGKVNQDYINTFINDANTFLGSAEKDYGGLSWGNASDVYNTKRIAASDLSYRSSIIRKWLNSQKSVIDEDTYKSLASTLDTIDTNTSKLTESFMSARDFYAKFESEDEYNEAVKQQEEYAAKLDFDLDKGKAEIDGLYSQKTEIESIVKELKSLAPAKGTTLSPTQIQKQTERREQLFARLKELGVVEGEGVNALLESIDASISEKERYLREASRLQEWQALSAVGDPNSEYYDPEFASKSGYVSTKSDGFWDRLSSQYGMGYDDLAYEYINNQQDGIRDEIKNKHSIWGAAGHELSYEENAYDQLKENEIAIYNYYYATGGKEAAQKYLDSIQETLNARKAGVMFENLEGKWALELLFGVEAGLDQFESGIENLFSSADYIPPSATQMTSQMVREDLGKSDFKILGNTVGQIAYDAINTTSNMLPSILASTAINAVAPGAGAVVGAGLLGASASGNAYAEMLNLGYDKGQARLYSGLVGASEAGLQYLLGGIASLGGGPLKNIGAKALSKIDNAFARVAITLGKEMVSEGFEEGLQTVLEPWFKSIATGVDFEAPNIDEVLYSSLLGAISAAGIGGLGTIAGGVREAKADKMALNTYGGQSQALVDEALGSQFSDVKATGQKFQDKLNSGKSLSGHNLRELLDVTDNSKIKSAVFKRLGELGETTDVTAVGEVLVKYALGEKLSSKDNAILNNSTAGHQVLTELNESNIKSGGLANNWAENIGTRTVRPDVYNRSAYRLAEELAGVTPAEDVAVPDEKSSVLTADASKKESVEKSKFDVSEDGKTTYNGKEVSIKGIDSITDGNVTLILENGEKVNATDVRLGSRSVAAVYEAVTRMGASAETANIILENIGDVDIESIPNYVGDSTLAYRYGTINFKRGLADLSIPEAQKALLFERGRRDAETKAEQQTPKLATKKTADTKPKKNGIFYEDETIYDEETASPIQKESIKRIEELAMLSPSLEFHVYSSEVEDGGRVAIIDGVRVEAAANGFFTDGNKVYIDLNAGKMGEGTMLYTASHEIGHYIRRQSATAFKTIGDFLMEQYSESDASVESLIEEQKKKIIRRYKRDEKSLPSEAKLFDMAYEELVCDAMSTMLASPTAFEKLAALKAKDKNAFRILGEAIKAFLRKVKTLFSTYKNKTPDAREADYVSKFSKEAYEKLQDLYLKAFVEAEANYESAERTLADNGISVNDETESASLFSVRDVLNDEQRKKVSLALATRFGVTQQEAMDWLKAETSMASLILNPKYSQYLDYTPDPNEVAIKQNSDYPQGTVDFSPICAKRREFTSVMNNILRLFPNHVFAATDLAKIRTIMQEEGMTIPCGICYVEDRRQLDTIVAQNFIDSLKLYREGSKTRPDGKPFNANQLKGLSLIDGDSYTPSVYELVSLEGLNVLKEKNPSMAEAWVKFNNARGMQAVRLLANEAEYKRQILKYSNKTVQSKNDHGGLRVYSFSDAEMFHLIDIIQVITDSATVGLYLQGYTKVNEYARTVKDTGEKLNRSLIPKGELGYHIEDGNVVLDYDTVEGIDINHPDFFDNKDNPDVGNITIGVSDVQIRAAMVSDFVDQIIPFHTGQSDEVLGEKGISTWFNYKDFQTEKDIATGKVSEHQINIYTEVLQVLEKEGKPINKRSFVEKFLQVCKENGLTPRFSQFLNTNEKGEYVYTEGYHKMLVDFKTFAQTEVGEYLPQRAVKPIFDNEYITQILKDYVKSQKVKDAELAESMPKVIERITNEIVRPDEVKFSDRNPYSYETLTSKPDMKLTTVGGTVPSNRADVVAEAKKNAAKVGKFNPKDGSVSVRVDDIGTDVIVTKKSLVHGLDRRMPTQAPVLVKVGEVLKNSIKINELTPRAGEVKNTYVLIGAAQGQDGSLYVASFVVNKYSNEVAEIDVLYSANAKKETAALLPKFTDNSATPTVSDISIAQLLDYVNRHFPDILPESVLRHYGHDARPEGKLGESALYSDRDNIGYHAGDLGKSEYYYMQGYGRGTGHFGTGTYFVGTEEKISGDNTYGKRPHHAVDFSDYNLYKIKGEKDGYELHEQLRVIDGGVRQDFYEKALDDEFRFYPYVNVFDLADKKYKTESNTWEEAYIPVWKDIANQRGIEYQSEEEWGKKNNFPADDEYFADYYSEYLEKTVTEATEAVEEEYSRFRDTYFRLWLRFGSSNTRRAMQKTILYQQEISPDGKRDYHAELDKKYDSLATVFMKALGYEGIDVRGTRLDNVEYGSVIYDLKEDTVLYSDREIEPVTEAEYKALEKHFGVTGNFRVAGYLLPDGKLLDFSGKHWGDTTSRSRQVDHRDAGEVLNRGNNGINDMVDMIGSGCIRLMPEVGGINLATYPNEKQRRVLSVYIKQMLATEGQVIVDYDAVGGDTVHSRVYEKYASSSQILSDIRNYFNGARQSELMSFHTSYSDRDSDSISTRSLLANALEGAAQNDIERQKLAQYKSKISLIEAEQAKLSEIRLKIRELSFAKGSRDTEQIRSLQFEEKQAANRINTYDRQLLNLQSTTALKNVLEREKKLAYEKAKKEGKQALANYREKAAATQRELINRWQDSRKQAVEGRNKTAMRHKIKDIAKELDTLLRNPTSKKHIKEELRKSVAEALMAINMDTVGADERVAKYDALIAKSKDPDIIAELTETRDRIQLQGDNLKEKLDALRMAYEKIKDSEDIELSMAYQEVIRNSIAAVSEKVGKTSIRNMTLEQLEMVYELYSMIRKTIRNANKAFKAKKGETIMQMAEAVNDQVRTVGGQPYKRNAVSAAVQRASWTFLKPFVAFRTIGSVTLTNLYKELRAGEDTFYGDVSAAQAFIEEQYKKHGFKSWNMKETKTFTAKSGKSFDLTLEQMMSMYAYSRRDQAHAHIIEGGIVFEDALVVEKKHGIPIKYEVTTKDAFNLSEETFAEIVDSLTAEQKAFVEEMQAYLSETMGAKGNEVSMEMLGVKLFKEKFYLPIKSSQYYLNFSTEDAGEIKLKNPAFSKETVKHANNPIVLHNFTDLWAEHVNNMSMYHSFVLALEDFTRVYNYKTKTDEKVETMSTKKTIETAYPGATNYISNFLKSLNGGVRMDTVGFAEKFTSLAKKGAVLGSASVAIQQPSAVMRAMASINPAYFVTSAPKSINLLKHKQDWAELKKYAPIAGIKEMGRFDVGMGKDTADWIKANGNVMTKIEDVLSVAPAFMDEVTWVSIWNAVKRETIHKHKNLSPKSEEFLKIAGERFTDVISLTQVYDSVFSRSDLMRNKSWIAKALTAFMAEPTTTLNMLWDSWVQGKRSGSVKGFAKVTSATTGAVVASLVLNAALKSIVMAMRDDDEDESFAEKYVEHFFGDFKDSLNPLTLIPVAKDVVSIFKGYDVERMDMALFSDLKTAIDAFDSDTKTDYEKWSGLIGAISAFFGLPVKNVERDIRGLINTIFGDSENTTAEGLLNAMEAGWTGESKSNGQQLYEAMLNGDKEQVKRIEGRFKDQSAINTAIRKALRENDHRIKEAAVARNNGDIAEYMRIAKSIIAEGHFSQDNVVAAINAEISALNKGESTTSTTGKESSIFKMEDYYNAIVGSDQATAAAVKEDMIRTDVKNGKDREEAEANFVSRFVSHCREEYEEGYLSDREAKSMLTQYAGKSEEDAASKVQYWAFKQEYPDYDLTEDAVTKYYSDVKPSGISIKVYYDYSEQRSKCKGTDSDGDGKTDSGSLKREILRVINSLPITASQKDALYYLNGWSASTLNEAPWR